MPIWGFTPGYFAGLVWRPMSQGQHLKVTNEGSFFVHKQKANSNVWGMGHNSHQCYEVENLGKNSMLTSEYILMWFSADIDQ